MTKAQPTKRPPKSSTASTIPGRFYTFVVVLLTAFVLGLTAMAFPIPWLQTEVVPITDVADTATQPATTVDAVDDPAAPANESAMTTEQLQRLAGVSFGLAVLSLILPRRRKNRRKGLSAGQVARESGLPVVGSLFTNEQDRSSASGGEGRLLRGVVSMCEMILCVMFMLALVAGYTKPDLAAQFRQDPIAAYFAAVHHLTGMVQSWLPPNLKFP